MLSLIQQAWTCVWLPTQCASDPQFMLAWIQDPYFIGERAVASLIAGVCVPNRRQGD